MEGYQNNLSTSEFLYIIFTKTHLKLDKVIKLMKIKKRTYLETKELFETKSKIIEMFNLLSMETNDDELRNLYLYLSKLLSSTELNNIQKVIDFCKKSKLEDRKDKLKK